MSENLIAKDALDSPDRDFLTWAGRFAVVPPVAVTVLLSTSMDAKATGTHKSGGSWDGFGRKSDGRGIFGGKGGFGGKSGFGSDGRKQKLLLEIALKLCNLRECRTQVTQPGFWPQLTGYGWPGLRASHTFSSPDVRPSARSVPTTPPFGRF